MDFNSRSLLGDRINWFIDDGITRAAAAGPKRTYLGCSAIGGTCERAVQYAAMAAMAAGGACPAHAPSPKPAPARTLRIFERGHAGEDMAARWMRTAGFLLDTRDPLTGEQFAVSFCDGRLLGHADGIITHWLRPEDCPVELPALWECKVLGKPGWGRLKKDHVRRAYPHYYGQVQLYMHGLRLPRCVFTAVNADTMEICHELVEADAAEAERLIGRAGRIFLAAGNGELVPRGETTEAAMACRMCDWAEECWRGGNVFQL